MVLRFCFWLREECNERSEYDDSQQQRSSFEYKALKLTEVQVEKLQIEDSCIDNPIS